MGSARAFGSPPGPTMSAAVASQPNIWKPQFIPGKRFFRLFISHTHPHARDVNLLSAALSAHGVAAFVAHDAIQPTKQWLDVIVQALRECEALAAYLTSDFHNSEWTDQEVGAAIARDLLVFPLRLDVNPYGFIGRYQAMHAAGKDPNDLASEIANVLHADPLTRDAMAEVVVDRFVHSHSYDNARANLKRLESLAADVWTPSLAKAVDEGVAANDQISQAVIGFDPNTKNVGDEALKLVAPLLS
jgi:hypothetical protein